MGNHDWRNIGKIAGITVAIGVYPGTKVVAGLYRAMDAYRAAADRTLASPKLDFHVPADGSVNFQNQVEAEVPDGFWARQAYAGVVKNEIMKSLGPGWNFDRGENVLWRAETESVWDPLTERNVEVPGRISMKGGMPNGRTVPWRDYNGDQRVGNLSKRELKQMRRSEFKSVTSMHGTM